MNSELCCGSVYSAVQIVALGHVVLRPWLVLEPSRVSTPVGVVFSSLTFVGFFRSFLWAPFIIHPDISSLQQENWCEVKCSWNCSLS